MNVMPIERIPDFEMRIKRQDAFWHGAVLDRPVLNITMPKPSVERQPQINKDFPTLRDRWMDAEYVAETAAISVRNTDYLGDALPQADPNLGPEVFSAFFGTELEYGESTSWSVANLFDWKEVDTLQFSEENLYWKKINEITEILLEKGKDLFYTGLTDLHPGGDAIVAFRDPQRMNLDMLDNPDDIKRLLERVSKVYEKVFGILADKLTAHCQPITCWAGIVSTVTVHGVFP